MDISQKTTGAWIKAQRPREFKKSPFVTPADQSVAEKSPKPPSQRTDPQGFDSAFLTAAVNPIDLLNPANNLIRIV